MKEKNNIFLMIIAVVALIATVGGATYAYFASSITEGEGLNLDITAEASTAQFTVTGGNFGFTVTGAEMQQGNSGLTVGNEAKGTFSSLYVTLKSETAEKITCTYDVLFEWDEGSGYTPTAGYKELEKQNISQLIEFGVSQFGLVSSPSDNLSEGDIEMLYWVNFDKITNPINQGGYGGIVAKNATISSSGGNETKAEWWGYVHMINLPVDQSSLAGTGSKNYSGRFYVDNVVC